MKRMTMKFMALALLMVAGTASVFAQGVAFTSTSLPRQMRQEGITETAGEVVLTALNAGEIPATAVQGSTIDFVFSTAITNNSTAVTNNISLVNNISCTGPTFGLGPACPATVLSAALTGTQTVRVRFANANTAFAVGDSITLSRVRVNANAALGVGSVTVTMSGISQDPVLRPITFTDPQRQVGVLNPTLSVNFNHSSLTAFPIALMRTCAFPNIGTPVALPAPNNNPPADPLDATFGPPSGSGLFSIRIGEVFPGALTTTAQEVAFSPNLLPANGSLVSITISGVPAGMTLIFVGNTGATGLPIVFGAPTPAPTVDQGTAGAPISFAFAVNASDTAQVERAHFVFQLKPTGTSTTNPLSIAAVGTPVNIQAQVSVAPITNTDSVIVRFAANQIGPTTVATITDCTTRILMTWVATVADVETGVALNNTSSDDAAFGAGPLLGATPQNGTCTLTGYPSAGGTPVSFTTATINAGSSLAFLMSATTGFSNFTGYVLTVCNFEAAHAFTFITNGRGTVTGPTLAQGYVANIIQPGTRPGALGASESLGN